MTIWIIFVLLSLVALAFVVWPLFKSSGRLDPMLAVVIVLVVGLSAGLYYKIGQPNVSSGADALPDETEMMASLAKRLENDPNDVDGWLLLGRSYQSMQQFDEAIKAFETAIEVEQGQNGQSLTALAIVLLETHGGQMNERASSLLESALMLEPTNQNALFYGGGAAAWRGDTDLAADRWEVLLNQNAPPEVQDLLRRKISEWRGEPVAVTEPAAVAEPAPVVEPPSDAVITINISISRAAQAELPADATVYVIARDPAQPSPPIAVSPRRLAELPATVSLTDKNSMVAGRELSAFPDLEIVVRVSLTGSPRAQSGDWSGSRIVNTTETSVIDLVIDQKVP